MPNPITDRMEKMSEAYVAAICAANGYTFSIPPSDYDGVDCIVNCPDVPSEDCVGYDESPSICAQLKSTFSHAEYTISEDEIIHYKLKVGNYNQLVKKRATPTILILFIMPDDIDEWLEHSTEHLKLKKCAYWISLLGRKPSTNHSTVTVEIPCSNALSAEELKRIMIKVAKEESL